mgnify:CR=1 FL=1
MEWRKGVEGRRPRGSRAAPWHVLSEAKANVLDFKSAKVCSNLKG